MDPLLWLLQLVYAFGWTSNSWSFANFLGDYCVSYGASILDTSVGITKTVKVQMISKYLPPFISIRKVGASARILAKPKRNSAPTPELFT